MVDYVIPGNDDAVRSVKVLIGVLTNAIAEVNGNEVLDFLGEESKEKTPQTSKKPVEETKGEISKETKVEEPKEVVEELPVEKPKAGIKGYSKMKKSEIIEQLNK